MANYTSVRRLICVNESLSIALAECATAHRLPVTLEYYEACRSELKARLHEKQLKTGFGRAYLKRRLEGESRTAAWKASRSDAGATASRTILFVCPRGK
jgi:hypothetical protein